jgi:hypothetical protein
VRGGGEGHGGGGGRAVAARVAKGEDRGEPRRLGGDPGDPLLPAGGPRTGPDFLVRRRDKRCRDLLGRVWPGAAAGSQPPLRLVAMPALASLSGREERSVYRKQSSVSLFMGNGEV